ncbi:rhomboid-related protein 3 isoform X2 [Hypanus sabinus]|uniref:rhomboid-related protein 3 isoform X2 n=1 Tax=Hypanus sabinus TaxID=79690 RepID=UPI0028C4556B|nr:rhomboid-related protein 3 isoform X2 [Hypanus sabinus]
MSSKRTNSFRRAVLLGSRRLRANSLLEETGLTLGQRFIRHIAYETLPRGLDRRWYYDSYTCYPPPWFIVTVTVLEGGAPGFQCNAADSGRCSPGDGPWIPPNQLHLPQWGSCRFTGRIGGRHDCARSGFLGRSLCTHLCTSGQRSHELVWNEMSVQTDPDGNCHDLYESGVWPCCLVAIPPTRPPVLCPSQLCVSPRRSAGGDHAGSGDPQELRAETPRTVHLVDLCPRLSRLCALCHPLEHLRLQSPRNRNASPSLILRTGQASMISQPGL